jgi:hypothetical protein
MPYRCATHNLVLLCSRCLLIALQANPRQTELVDPRGLTRTHIGQVRTEIPYRHCGQELTCMACIDDALLGQGSA